MKEVTCNKCGWVAFAVTRQYAEDEVSRFNEYFDKLSQEDQNNFYGGRKSSIVTYEHCFLCNNPYSNFRDTAEGDCPDGCTLQPIIQD